MPANRNSILRYKTIDRMLRDGRKATLEELIDACNDALYDCNGYGGVSRRSVQNDIREMRYSQALGYYAPIKVVDRKYYTYSDSSYTITQTPLTEEDLSQLSEAVGLVKQMSSFKGFDNLEDVVNRLEDYVSSIRTNKEPVILLEGNERLRGLEHITPLHDAIIDRRPVKIAYKTFKAHEPRSFCFSPYILKEFRNRWFIFGKRHDSNEFPVINLALDRIERIEDAPRSEKYRKESTFHSKTYFRNIIGVSLGEDTPVEHVVFSVAADQVPYVRTKPLHESQKEVELCDDGSVLFSIDVAHNYELERDILGFGEGITVLEPASLVKKLHKRLEKMTENYNKSLHKSKNISG